jgi:hypothetical protein
VFTTLIQTERSSKKIARALRGREFGLKTTMDRGIGLQMELFFPTVAKQADTNV